METNYHMIEYMGDKEKVLQFLSESNSQFKERLQYIMKLEKAKIIWKEANRLSKVWYSIKFKKCKYNQDLYIKVMRYDK